jgi:NAD(P)-dependent dehydrogenase (short-subunit alcohol dehydrogenase family)
MAKHVLVTGVGKGIGRAIATKLLAEGWTVTGTYKSSAQEAQAFADSAEGLDVVQVDLGSRDEREELLARFADTELDGLVNNAGIVEFEKLGVYDYDTWSETFEVNLQAPVHLTLGFRSQLVPGSAVVNIASVDGLTGSYNTPAYAASKAALLSATQSLANVLGADGIRVNAVSPGWIDTEMTVLADEARRFTPLGRLGDPAEVGDAVAWLLGDQAEFVTGASVVIDGGYSNVDPVLKAEADEDR